MPRTCTVCSHPEREAIDRALAEGVAFPALVAEHGVSKDALSRHKTRHLPAVLVKAAEAEEVARADDLLSEVRGLQARTLSILEAAEATREYRTALSAIREARSNLELLAKLVGELDESPTVNVLIAESVQVAILSALEPHPQAKRAVAESLAALEAGDG